MLRKFKNPFRPKTRKTSPSKMRAIKVTIFIRVSFSIVSKALPILVLCAASGVELFGEILRRPDRKSRRFSACYFVCESNFSGQIRTQIGMGFPVTEHLGNF